MLILFMLFCSATPLALWSRRRGLALLQIPLIVGMWAYAAENMVFAGGSSAVHTVLTVLFYANLLFTEFAVIRYCLDVGCELQKRKGSANTAALSEE